MKSVEQMKQEMEKRLENLEARRRSLESQASSINQRFAQVRQEIGRLTSAIQVLNGETPASEQPLRLFPGIVLPAEACTPIPEETQKMILNRQPTKFDHPKEDLDANIPSEQPPAPPGFHWAKNSFGEDSLVKDGVELPPMEEPIVPIKPFGVMPISGVSNDFDDPKDLY